MNARNTLAATLLAAAALAAHNARAEPVTIEFAYPYSHLFDVTYEKIMPRFRELHPDIEVSFRATYEDYEDGTNTVLREAVAGALPDVTMQGLNRQAILVEKGIAKSLEPFIEKESDFEKAGYHAAMLELGTFEGAVHGLPFSISLPVGYYNMDLMGQAGIDSAEALPTSWDEGRRALRGAARGGRREPDLLGLEHHRQLVPAGVDVVAGRPDGRATPTSASTPPKDLPRSRPCTGSSAAARCATSTGRPRSPPSPPARSR